MVLCCRTRHSRGCGAQAGGTPHTLAHGSGSNTREGKPSMGSAAAGARTEDTPQRTGLTLRGLPHQPAVLPNAAFCWGAQTQESQNTALDSSTSSRPLLLLPISTDPSQGLGPGPQLSPSLPSTGNIRHIPACPELLQRDLGSAACQDW